MGPRLDQTAFELSPCPRCKPNLLHLQHYGGGVAVECVQCGMRSPRARSVDEAVIGWNVLASRLGEAPSYALVPDHDCTREWDFGKYMADGRSLWVGRITRPPSGYEHETTCLHIETPEKPELAFCLNQADVEFLSTIAYAILGTGLSERWMERIVEAAKTPTR